MRLIDEIEAAATHDYEASQLRQSPWWGEIKAALLAGEEMAQHAGHDGCDVFHEALNSFRAATEGTQS